MSTTSQVANTATATSVTTGVMATGMGLTQWVSENALVITVSCTIVSLVVGLVFHILNTRISNKRKDIQSKQVSLQRAQMIAKWRDEGKTENEINSILDMAGVK